MPAYIPEDNPLTPKNQSDLRSSVRHDGNSGYIFVNNYQRRYPMEEHKEASLSVEFPGEKISFPKLSIHDKDYFFLPFNMKLGEALLKTALVSPLCILNNMEKTYVFYGDREPQFEVQGKLEHTKLIALNRQDARNAWKVVLKQEHLIISYAAVLQTEQGIEILGSAPLQLKVYPDFDVTPDGWLKADKVGEFTVYRKDSKEFAVKANTSISSQGEKKSYLIELEPWKEEVNDCFLIIRYQGDSARAYINGEFVTDHFYTGRDWEIGLKHFDFPQKLEIEIYPLQENAKVYLEQWPMMKDGAACELSEVSVRLEFKAVICI
jgi:hypothetical protein